MTPNACAAASAAAICCTSGSAVGCREAASAAKPLAQRLAGEQLHRQEGDPTARRVVEAEVEEAADVGVRDAPRELDLAPEALEQRRGCRRDRRGWS